MVSGVKAGSRIPGDAFLMGGFEALGYAVILRGDRDIGNELLLTSARLGNGTLRRNDHGWIVQSTSGMQPNTLELQLDRIVKSYPAEMAKRTVIYDSKHNSYDQMDIWSGSR